MHRLLRKYPAVVRDMENRHLRYNETLSLLKQLETQGDTLVLRPSRPLPIRRVENAPERLQAAYDIGREDAQEHLPEIRQFLEEKNITGK